MRTFARSTFSFRLRSRSKSFNPSYDRPNWRPSSTK